VRCRCTGRQERGKREGEAAGDSKLSRTAKKLLCFDLDFGLVAVILDNVILNKRIVLMKYILCND
jgi:hypothetical protein